MAAVAPGRRREFGGRTPVVVCPKAVSDSRSSQTCLDPDASRVSVDIRRSYDLQLLFELAFFCCGQQIHERSGIADSPNE